MSTMPGLSPLNDDIPVPPASLVERVLWFVPIVGWMTAHQLYERRHFPRYARLEKQLFARPKPEALMWGDDRCQMIATIVCQELQKEFLWPNDHFVPTDPIALVVWPHRIRVQTELLFAMQEVELKLGVDARGWARILGPTTTLAEITAFIVATPPRRKPG